MSPIDGTVAAVNLQAGQQVAGGSSTADVVVVGPGGYEVATTVLVADVGQVKLGDAATVRPDGTSSDPPRGSPPPGAAWAAAWAGPSSAVVESGAGSAADARPGLVNSGALGAPN